MTARWYAALLAAMLAACSSNGSSPDGSSSVIGTTCVTDPDCGDTSVYGCGFGVSGIGHCELCGSAEGQICCNADAPDATIQEIDNTASCREGLICHLTTDTGFRCYGPPPPFDAATTD
jgi:hypothetical protein